MIAIKVKLVREGAREPTRAYADDAGWDLYSCSSVVIPPECKRAVPIGICVEVPPGWETRIVGRSSTWAKLSCYTNPGEIDAGFRDELFAMLWNVHPSRTVSIARGDRVAQLMLVQVPESRIEVVEELSTSERGNGGFGSSGA